MNINQEHAVYVVAILLQIGLLIYFFGRTKKMGKAKKTNEKTGNLFQVGSYEHTRDLALNVTQQQLGLDIPASSTKVYGIVMDWDMSGTVLTLSAYINGAANALLSNGSSITGVGKHPNVAEQASDYVQVAQNFISKCMPVSDTSLPIPGTVRFYMLTNKGIFAAQELLSAIDDNSSPWVGLFFRGSMLLDEMKKGGEA